MSVSIKFSYYGIIYSMYEIGKTYNGPKRMRRRKLFIDGVLHDYFEKYHTISYLITQWWTLPLIRIDVGHIWSTEQNLLRAG